MQKRQPSCSPRRGQRRPRLEFSKWLSIVDTVGYLCISCGMLGILLLRSDLAAYMLGMFQSLTAAFVSLRLGYTAKAGVENYKKIAGTYRALGIEEQEKELG